MGRRAALLLLFTVSGCSPAAVGTTTQAPPEPPAPSAARTPRSAPRRPAPEVMQALAELERNPNLHVEVTGPRAELVRKAMLRAAHGRIAVDRIRLGEHDPDVSTSRPVEFRFFVPPASVDPADEPLVRSIHAYVPQ